MPAALAIDREAVRTLVVAVGVREAARQMGLKESTVQAWSARGKWTEKVKQAQATAAERRIVPQQNAIVPQKDVQPTVTSPADSLATALAEDSNATKTGFSRMARTVAEAAANYKAPKVLKNARSLRDVATIAGQVHGWDAKTGEDRRVMINIGILTQ